VVRFLIKLLSFIASVIPEGVTYKFMRIIFTTLTMCLILLTVVQAQPSKAKSVRSNLLVTTEWLAKNLNDPKLVILQIGRDQKVYDEGHIPNARYLKYTDIITMRDQIPNELPPVEKLQQLFSSLGVSNDSRIILYSDVQNLLAARVYFTLDYLGYGDQAALLDGSIDKWKADKREISKAAPTIKTGNFTPRLNLKVNVSREAVKDISWLNSKTENSDVLLLDARPADAYDGTAKNANLPRNGHIPGAGNVYWMDTLTSKEIPTLKAVKDLQKMYEVEGIGSDKKVVTYCWIGMMASHAYFTLKYLGYDVAMYDGSFTEWSKSEGTEVVVGKSRK
jgi:thiosulfate/3-mercaptopyruvate sulfurtransferase